ncbi:unnamed protein product [Cylindrotheca closterium]|uniref:Calmodulin-lysine N-methyltransferase n=1 Tax=Cylindrotheca closterium TaxID=2856 RepID=A0AAD2FI37_9STRA|nr:unnamed protein product [Cylindrotheca closterium]
MQEIIALPFKGDPSLMRPASKDFRCHESLERHFVAAAADADDDDVAHDHYAYDVSGSGQVVMFQCTLPETNKFLTFSCQEPSCGVLMEDEPAATKEEDGAMDPFFFDTGYTLAGKTGFQVWPGSRLVVEAMTFVDASNNHDSPRLRTWQERMANGAKVLELGSGVGVVGASLASFGAHVLLSDLQTLVQNSTQPNLQRNANNKNQQSFRANYDDTEIVLSSPPRPSWLPSNAVRIGKGWAASTAVDWTIPLPEQVQHIRASKASTTNSADSSSSSENILGQIEVVIASDCVWLVSMMEPLFDTVQYVFQHNPNAKLLLSFQRRDGSTTTPESSDSSESSMFTTVDKILTAIQHDRKWSVQCLAWRYVNQTDQNEIFLFEVSPNH